ncbi:hypothetical protein [Absidia glauca]|uniref:Uncharacterized protein n=1 Tax=Absidia glauca TaxID=4829 RepID=A0A163JL05_ABSGL|nr:hypothetical protein [Absidia glauca]
MADQRQQQQQQQQQQQKQLGDLLQKQQQFKGSDHYGKKPYVYKQIQVYDKQHQQQVADLVQQPPPPSPSPPPPQQRDIPYPVSARENRVNVTNAHYEEFLRQVLDEINNKPPPRSCSDAVLFATNEMYAQEGDFIRTSGEQALEDSDDRTPGARRRPIFSNMVLTDGFAVNVLFTRPTSSTTLPDLELDDIARPHVADHFDLWGVDPGIKDIFMATDGASQYRKFSAAEYRCKTGQTRRKAECDRLHRQANITTIESAIPTTKTSSSSSFIAAVRYILENLSPLLALYGDVIWAQQRLWNYSGAQKLDHEMAQIFLNGGRKYDPSTAPHPTMQHRTN